MAEHPRGAVVLIEPYVEEPATVLAPHDATRGGGYRVGQVRAGRKVAPPDGVELRACFVRPPGEQLVIGRMAGAAKAEIALAGAERVAVEQGLRRAATARLPAQDRML